MPVAKLSAKKELKTVDTIVLGQDYGHYWYLLKIIISIKPYFDTSNGELLTVKNIVRNGSV